MLLQGCGTKWLFVCLSPGPMDATAEAPRTFPPPQLIPGMVNSQAERPDSAEGACGGSRGCSVAALPFERRPRGRAGAWGVGPGSRPAWLSLIWHKPTHTPSRALTGVSGFPGLLDTHVELPVLALVVGAAVALGALLCLGILVSCAVYREGKKAAGGCKGGRPDEGHTHTPSPNFGQEA